MKFKWIMLTIVLLQASLCTIEALRAVRCHETGSECWPWFFAFIVNIPASVIFERVHGAIVNQFGMQSFAAQTRLTFGIYFLGGSLWWGMIALLVRSLVRFFKKRDLIGERPSK